MKFKLIFGVILMVLGTKTIVWGQKALPPELSPWEVTHYTDPASEVPFDAIFLDNYPLGSPSPDPPAILLLDQKGDLMWYDANLFRRLGFTLLSNGRMSYNEDRDFFILDSNFLIVDTLRCANGRIRDIHELIVDDRGHYWLICSWDTTMDVSHVNTISGGPGNSAASVRYNFLQEFDANLNLLKEWDSSPYFLPEDMDTNYFLSPGTMDLMHINSIDVDTSGEVLISSRNLSEVTCIDWNTGSLKWRLGGKHNQFTFQNDPGLSGQHYARFQENDQVTIFDNGTFHSPPRSRGIRYQLDHNAMTATPIWEYTHPGQVSSAMGSFQHFPDGDGLICWGVSAPIPPFNFTYVSGDSIPLMEFKFFENYRTYRAQAFDLPFQFDRPEISCLPAPGGVTLSVVGNPAVAKWSEGTVGMSITVSDTGWYQVYVPKGIGWAASLPFYFGDVNDPCAGVGIDPELENHPVELGIWDLFGRPVLHPNGEIYISVNLVMVPSGKNLSVKRISGCPILILTFG